MKNSFVALLLAKSDSSRLPNKNLLLYKGRAMFMENVEKCLKIFPEVYVSSDDVNILKRVEEIGALPIKRPRELCGDTPNIPVYRHAFEYMHRPMGIIAVQVNSPTIDAMIIEDIHEMMKIGIDEIMTCHEDYSIYGSVWAMTRQRLETYGDPYKPTPQVLVVDKSIDIHTKEDYNKALENA